MPHGSHKTLLPCEDHGTGTWPKMASSGESRPVVFPSPRWAALLKSLVSSDTPSSDTQVTDQHEKVDAYGTAAETAALEVHVQEGCELAAAFNQTSKTSFSNKTFQIPMGTLVLAGTKTGVVTISGSKVSLLKRTAQCRKSGSKAHSRK